MDLIAGAHFEYEIVTFADGDLLVFVSDGVVEAFDASGDAAIAAVAAQIDQAACEHDGAFNA